MIGYVLWIDVAVGKAIIWCEDQGDLAYYSRHRDASQTAVCKGDWVQFDLTEKGNMRLAANAVILDEVGYPDLSEMLVEAAPLPKAASTAVTADHPARATGAGRSFEASGGVEVVTEGNVIPFPAFSKWHTAARYG